MVLSPRASPVRPDGYEALKARVHSLKKEAQRVVKTSQVAKEVRACARRGGSWHGACMPLKRLVLRVAEPRRTHLRCGAQHEAKEIHCGLLFLMGSRQGG